MGAIINPIKNKGWAVSASGLTITGKVEKYLTYADLLAITETPPFLAIVVDATGDSTVNTGSALYMSKIEEDESITWIKLYETELMDRDLGVALTWSYLIGKPASSPADIDNAVNKTHEHVNSGVLGSLAVNMGGNLLYNGNVVAMAQQLVNYLSITTYNSFLETHNTLHDTIEERISDIENIAEANLPIITPTPSGTVEEPYPLILGKWYVIDNTTLHGSLPVAPSNNANILLDLTIGSTATLYHSSFPDGIVSINYSGTYKLWYSSIYNKWLVLGIRESET